MADFVFPLTLTLDVQSLTMSLVNIASPPGGEDRLADSIEAALRALPHLEVSRTGHTVVARTSAGHAERVVVAGCLTAWSSEPLAYVEMGQLFGPGAADAKGSLAVTLKAAALDSYGRDMTFVYYPGEKLPSHLSDNAEFVLLAEPTNAAVRGGPLDHPCAQRLVEISEVAPVSDVGGALAAVGVAAVAFGPGDPSIAGTPDEFVPTAQLTQCEFVLRQWLTA